MRRSSTVSVLTIWVLVTAGADAQSPSLEVLLDRASANAVDLLARLSHVVAEERYVQVMGQPSRKRTLRSEFLLLGDPISSSWLAFRDVFEVDGRSVRRAEDEDRLARSFFEQPFQDLTDTVRRAVDLSRASAKYNLADLGTLNNPLLVMTFLQPVHRPRFRFVRARLDRKLGPRVRTVRYDEFQRPTLMSVGPNVDLRASGLLWIDEDTGRIVKTELEVGERFPPTEIVTTFAFDDGLGVSVPVDMREFYPVAGHIRSTVTYGPFTRLQVNSAEIVR